MPDQSICLEFDLLRSFWPNAPEALVRAIADQSADIFAKYGINTDLRRDHFMAQISHESDGGTIVRENMRYDYKNIMDNFSAAAGSSAKVTAQEAIYYASLNKKGDWHPFAVRVYGTGNAHMAGELGNTQPDDGWMFVGGGLLQETGRDAYLRATSLSGVDIVSNPDLIAAPQYALLIAAAAFARPNTLAACDRDDLSGVTKIVNGGHNGLASRRKWLGRWRIAVKDTANPDAPRVLEHGREGYQVEALQRRLTDLGYNVGKVDGHFGANTEAAVLDFQARNGFERTGKIDEATQKALETAPARDVSDERATATKDDVADHPIVKAAATNNTLLKTGIGLTTAAGAVDTSTTPATAPIAPAIDPVAKAQAAVDKIDQVHTMLSHLQTIARPYIDWLQSHPSLLLYGGVIAAFGFLLSRNNKVIASVIDRYRAGL